MTVLRWLWGQSGRPKRWQLRWLARVLGLAALAALLWRAWPAAIAAGLAYGLTVGLVARGGRTGAVVAVVLFAAGAGLLALLGERVWAAGLAVGLLLALADRREDARQPPVAKAPKAAQ